MAESTIGQLPKPAFTIQCAFTIDTLATGRVLAGRQIGTLEWSIETDAVDSNALRFKFNETTTGALDLLIVPSLSAANVTANGAWHWLSIAVDTAIVCEIDNQLTYIQTGVTDKDWINYTDSVIVIGARDKEGTDCWIGSVDEFAIYDSFLASSDRTILYKLWATGSPDAIPYTLSVDVTNITDSILPGAYTTPTITATVFGGVGPFTYAWTSDGAKLTADTPTASSTTYSGTGTDETTTETLTVTVTDTGDDNRQVSFDITTNITWYADFVVDIDTADVTTTVPNGTYNSPSVICNVVTGSGTTFFYTWTRLSGDNNLTPAIQTPGQSGPASPAQSWTGSGYNQQIQETWQCEVNNLLTGQSATDTISYDVTYGTLPVLTAVMSPPSIQDYTESVPFTTQVAVVTVSNGVPPYTYSWTRVSGSTVMAVDNAAAQSTTFTGSGSNETANEVWQCEVTDSTTPTPQTATADLLLDIEFADPPAALTVDVTPATLDVNGPNGYLTSDEATAAVSGGTPPYTYDWQISNITGQFYQIPPEPVTPSQASTRFRGLCVNTNGTVTYTCFVTDSTPGTPRTGSDSVTVTWYSF